VIGSDTLPDLIPVPFGGRDWLGPRLYADEYAEIGHAPQSVSFCEVMVDRQSLPGWLAITEPMHVAVGKAHSFARRNAIEPKDFDHERLIIRTHCEVTEDFTGFLETQQVHPTALHKLVSEQDYLDLLEANLGIGLMPESAVQSSRITCVPVKGLDLSRTVFAYAVAGRQRSPAVSTYKTPPG
jgi:DNA-binding transcriptional LysR family regulator